MLLVVVRGKMGIDSSGSKTILSDKERLNCRVLRVPYEMREERMRSMQERLKGCQGWQDEGNISTSNSTSGISSTEGVSSKEPCPTFKEVEKSFDDRFKIVISAMYKGVPNDKSGNKRKEEIAVTGLLSNEGRRNVEAESSSPCSKSPIVKVGKSSRSNEKKKHIPLDNQNLDFNTSSSCSQPKDIGWASGWKNRDVTWKYIEIDDDSPQDVVNKRNISQSDEYHRQHWGEVTQDMIDAWDNEPTSSSSTSVGTKGGKTSTISSSKDEQEIDEEEAKNMYARAHNVSGTIKANTSVGDNKNKWGMGWRTDPRKEKSKPWSNKNRISAPLRSGQSNKNVGVVLGVII